MREAPALTVGQTVWVTANRAPYGPSAQYPGEWKVVKINPRKARLSQPTGVGDQLRYLNADKTLISDTPPENRPAAVEVTTVAYRKPWIQGTVVRWADAPPKAGSGKLFVVISDRGDPEVVTRIVPLGNTTGRYWGNVAAAELTEVKLGDILRDDAQN